MNPNRNIKKIIGLILIITFSTINLLILLAFVYNLVEMDNPPSTISGIVFTLILLCFPIYYGISLWKSGVAELQNIPKPANGTITTSGIQITFKEYRLLIIRLTFKNPIIIFFAFLGLSFLISTLLNPSENFLMGIVMGIVYILIPFVFIQQAKRNYNSNKNLKEIIVYEFNIDNITITGETFKSTLQWSSLYKVKELNDWILLYTNKIIAICIPKTAFNSENELKAVLSFALNSNGVKRELK